MIVMDLTEQKWGKDIRESNLLDVLKVSTREVEVLGQNTEIDTRVPQNGSNLANHLFDPDI
jgi:hypothetical protein